jgi:hypothetical protein
MRRAVRDYKYEVNEGRMTEECVQYLTQLQKDWERHRIRLGVEAMRKEVLSMFPTCHIADSSNGCRSAVGTLTVMKASRRFQMNPQQL